jgi:hypothetical protein
LDSTEKILDRRIAGYWTGGQQIIEKEDSRIFGMRRKRICKREECGIYHIKPA